MNEWLCYTVLFYCFVCFNLNILPSPMNQGCWFKRNLLLWTWIIYLLQLAVTPPFPTCDFQHNSHTQLLLFIAWHLKFLPMLFVSPLCEPKWSGSRKTGICVWRLSSWAELVEEALRMLWKICAWLMIFY